MAIQSNDELVRVADEWFSNFCPSNLVKDGPSGTKNAELIMGRCLQKHGILTISGMTKAVHELGSQLEFVKEPTAAEKAAAAAKQAEARMQRDYMDSIKPQESFDEKVKRDAAKRQADEWVSGQEKARAQLGAAVLDYQCYGPGRVDITTTETIQRDLKTIRVPAHDGKGVDGKNTDYIATLSWVRAVILELPDHPKVSDVRVAVQRVREKFAQQAAKPKDKNQGW